MRCPRLRMSAVTALLVGFCALGGAIGAPTDLPRSCFVVHCEPTNADEAMFRELTDLVALAGLFEIPLTIDFTAQWAEMVLADTDKLVIVSSWLAAGHEISGHHHAYWATLDRDAQWAGYTNTPSCWRRIKANCSVRCPTTWRC